MENIFILASSTHPIPHSKITLLKDTVFRHAKVAQQDLNIKHDVNITVYPSAREVVAETDVGGYTASQDWIQIRINPTAEHLEEVIRNNLPATVYHEMHHAARWSSVGYGKNLTEVLITEGLGTIYQEERWQTCLLPWSTYTTGEIEIFLRLFNERGSEDARYGHAEHSKWFFGSTSDIPKWFGYKLGAYFIREAKRRNPGVTAASLVNINADEIIALSGQAMDIHQRDEK